MNFSKSKYCKLCQCPKILWMDKYKPEAAEEDSSAEARFETGNEVGDLAMRLFGDFTEATAYSDDGALDLNARIDKTRELLGKGADNICEASFSFGGLYCAVDILRRCGDGYAIYEVKSSTHVKHVYIIDVAYQKYVLERCGVKVTGTYVVNINPEYERHGDLDLNGLFKITDVSEDIKDEYELVEGNLAAAEKLLADPSEPDTDIDVYCESPYDCVYRKYCNALHNIPTPSVFDLYKLPLAKKVAAYKAGLVSFESVKDSELCANMFRARQVDFALNDRGTYIDKTGIAEFLDTLSYPLYFLDFETMQLAIPQFEGAKPYSQIPFQYSLHYIEKEGGEVKHKEFLAESGTDPRRAIAERLCEDIPRGVTTLAYNMSFECSRIKELARLFPDLSERLLDICSGITDLIIPFRNGCYYNRAIGGSFSIKSVLPAMFPDDPELDYHNLEGVHNGGEAMDVFPRIKSMPPEQAQAARRNLLEYCKLDTLAMVKIWQKLEEVVKN